MIEKKKSIGHKAMVGHPKAQATGIKSWPEDDRPREKLLKKGAGALSNSELLAILLRTGTAGTSAVDLFYMKKKVADPQIIAREGIFLNQELLDLGLAKLYKDPSSAPVKPEEVD